MSLFVEQKHSKHELKYNTKYLTVGRFITTNLGVFVLKVPDVIDIWSKDGTRLKSSRTSTVNTVFSKHSKEDKN